MHLETADSHNKLGQKLKLKEVNGYAHRLETKIFLGFPGFQT